MAAGSAFAKSKQSPDGRMDYMTQPDGRMDYMTQPDGEKFMSPPDGATAPPPKGKDGQYPIVTSGPHKGKRWSPKTPGPTNPGFKEGQESPAAVYLPALRAATALKYDRPDPKFDAALKNIEDRHAKDSQNIGLASHMNSRQNPREIADLRQQIDLRFKSDLERLVSDQQRKMGVREDQSLVKSIVRKVVAEKKAKPDFLDVDKDGDKKEPMKKAVADKKANPFAKKDEKKESVNESADLARMKQFLTRLNG
jgi:hypothetical protein